MNAAVATILELDAVLEAATIIANTFGLGDHAEQVDTWNVDDSDSVITASLEGVGLTLLLSVGDEVAARLMADQSGLASGLIAAAGAIVVGTDLSIGEIGLSTTTPSVWVGLFDGGRMCAVFGVAEHGDAPGSVDADGSVSGSSGHFGVEEIVAGVHAAPFEPIALQTGEYGSTLHAGPLELLHDVEMEVTVELGRTKLPIRELLALQPGVVIEIDRAAGAPIDILVNGRRIASGEVVVIDEEFGVRITEIVAVNETF